MTRKRVIIDLYTGCFFSGKNLPKTNTLTVPSFPRENWKTHAAPYAFEGEGVSNKWKAHVNAINSYILDKRDFFTNSRKDVADYIHCTKLSINVCIVGMGAATSNITLQSSKQNTLNKNSYSTILRSFSMFRLQSKKTSSAVYYLCSTWKQQNYKKNILPCISEFLSPGDSIVHDNRQDQSDRLFGC